MKTSISKYHNSQSKEKDTVTNPVFFIIGAQRSGTTLLRLLLNSHSDVAIPTESSQFMPFLNKKLLDGKPLSLSRKKIITQYLLNNSQFAKWGLEKAVLDSTLKKDMTLRQLISFLYTSYALNHGKTICGDKSPTFIRKMSILAEAYPDAKFIHVVRDGRDTLLSLRQLHAPAILNASLFAFEWKIKIFLIQKYIAHLKGRVIEIRYEDLLRNPHDELKKICGFLGISFQEQMLEFWKRSPEFIANHHSKLIFRPIDPSNIFKWRDELSGTEARKYAYFARKILEKYKYDIPSGSVSLGEKLIWWSELLIHVPKRMLSSIRVAFIMHVASKLGLKVGPACYDSKFR